MVAEVEVQLKAPARSGASLCLALGEPGVTGRGGLGTRV